MTTCRPTRAVIRLAHVPCRQPLYALAPLALGLHIQDAFSTTAPVASLNSTTSTPSHPFPAPSRHCILTRKHESMRLAVPPR